MRNLASLTAPAFFLLGLAGLAQAGTNGSGVPCETTEHVILECKSDKSGNIEVAAYTDGAADHAPTDIGKGDDCTEALESLVNDGDGHGHSYLVRAITTGSTDRTVYTLSAFGGECVPPKIVFETEQQWLAHQLGGLGGADAKCNAAAAAATPPLPGTYTAWLSDSNNDAINRVTNATVPYFLPDGSGGTAEKVADDFADILDCGGAGDPDCLDFSIRRDENGVQRINRAAWTGTVKDGLRTGTFCGDWTTNNADTPLTGVVNFVDRNWTAREVRACTQVNVGLYCFQD